ncbi:MAG: T9SS type A sorting domain-containing protein [Saprospiraceae bacterium]|nr:T9SS type A sorting domain-containing protein [Saprospiraceae bacterium]
MDYPQVMKTTGSYIYPFCQVQNRRRGYCRQCLVRVDHHWTSPDPVQNQPNLTMSKTNFWVVSGIFLLVLKPGGRLSYDASMANAYLDAEIASPKEDSLLLLYRPSPTEDWQVHPVSKVIPFLPTDGKGDIVINGLAPGEYALARGEFMTTSTANPSLQEHVRVFPNPTSGPLWVQWPDEHPPVVRIRWVDAMGRILDHRELNDQINSGIFEIPTTGLQPGTYFLQMFSQDGQQVQKTDSCPLSKHDFNGAS